MDKLTKDNFQKAKNDSVQKKTNWIKVGMSTCGIAAGAREVYDTLTEEVKRRNLNIDILKTGCLGMCYIEPLVEVCIEGVPHVVYGNVDTKAALGIVDKHICGKRVMNDHLVIK
ncbi:MAG: (2Fe-2S) ferredoxin domain-containing protein [Candidatus Omnitrophica bacterium]|nr:(2Fe-2S) ferredoxin domain-containing protein [Candidatus Omnitrophota bacterium]MDD5429104.1 (2Fe-2S) ferredoxin domain-containing protein [Candidatus Omnitrophota bacterium]